MANIYLKFSKNYSKKYEQEIIAKAASGDDQAFAVLYRRYYNKIYAFCAKLLNGKHDTEDAVQQVFYESWRSLKSFQGRALFSTWLSKIAIHTCMATHRKNRRIVLHLADDFIMNENAVDFMWGREENCPTELVYATEKRRLVKKLLRRMTPKKKVVFIMSDMKGMTAPEISKELKIPDATVRTRLFHARREFSTWVQKNQVYREILS